MDAIEYKRERVPSKLELLFKLDFSSYLSPALGLDMIEWRGGALEPADETVAAATGTSSVCKLELERRQRRSDSVHVEFLVKLLHARHGLLPCGEGEPESIATDFSDGLPIDAELVGEGVLGDGEGGADVDVVGRVEVEASAGGRVTVGVVQGQPAGVIVLFDVLERDESCELDRDITAVVVVLQPHYIVPVSETVKDLVGVEARDPVADDVEANSRHPSVLGRVVERSQSLILDITERLHEGVVFRVVLTAVVTIVVAATLMLTLTVIATTVARVEVGAVSRASVVCVSKRVSRSEFCLIRQTRSRPTA